MLKRRAFLSILAALTGSRALAQVAGPASAAPATPDMGRVVKVKLATSAGDIVIALYPDKAPITVANWLRYVDQKRYDASTIYRASHAPNDTTYGVVQGGLENNPAKILKPIAHESTTKTGLRHLDGTISMGRNAPGTATSDYFICVGDSPYLDAHPGEPGDNLGYSAFGQVVEGMDVVRKILALPTSPTLGVGVMKGQMLAPRIKVISARRVD